MGAVELIAFIFTIIGGFAGAVYLYEVGKRLVRTHRGLPETTDAELLIQLLGREAERVEGAMRGIAQETLDLELRLQRIEEGIARMGGG